MNSNHEDPEHRELADAQLTAYALGQLGAKERAEAEARLERSNKARQAVEETAAVAGHVQQANRQISPAPSSALRKAVCRRLTEMEVAEMETKPTPSPAKKSSGTWKLLASVAVAACVLVAVVALMWPAGQGARVAVRPDSAPDRQQPVDHETTAAPDATASSSTAAPGHDRKVHRWAGRLREQQAVDEAGTTPATDGAAEEPLAEIEAAEEAFDFDRVAGPRPEPAAAPPMEPAPAIAPGDPALPPMDRPAPRPLIAGKAGEALRPLATTPGETRAGEPGAPTGEATRVEGRFDEPLPDVRQSELPNDEQYDAIVEQGFSLTDNEPLSTFSADVDTASYANVRRFLRRGMIPPPGAVRIEEMVNYFPYDYPLPDDETPFSVDMEVAECPWNTEHRLLRIGLKGREIAGDQRGATNIVFLIDVSGSMRDENKLPLVKEAMAMLVEQLGEDDRVSIVTYAASTGVRLEPTCGNEHEKILTAIDGLIAGGSTHGSAGIQLAYKLAEEHFVEGGVNRVILATDGDLNVGITKDEELVELIQEKATSGVFLTVLGVGTGNLKDSKMEKLADKGNGAYAYLDDLREGRKVLVEEMAGSLITIAKDVKLQVEFNPAEVYAYRLVGYENRMLATEDFADDKKDAGEIGAGHTVTALYQIVPARLAQLKGRDDRPLKYRPRPEPADDDAVSNELCTLSLRYKDPDAEKSKLLEFAVTDKGLRFGEASDDFRFASAVASFAMVLRNSPHCGELNLSAVEEFAAGATGEDPHGYRAEFVEMIRRAKQIQGQ